MFVTDADALADYVASVADHHQDEVAGWTTWDAVVEECRRRVVAHIDEHGSFTIDLSVGAFVCR